jgi:beta-lactamase regulating signal transducer with metallopeptidase domain
MLEGIFLTVVNMSIIGSLAIILILAVRLLLLKAPKVFSYCLWAVVLFRLLVPFSFDSIVSLIPISADPISMNLVQVQGAPIYTGFGGIDYNAKTWLMEMAYGGNTNILALLVTTFKIVWLVAMLAMIVFGFYSLSKLKRKLRSAAYIGGNIYQSEFVDTPFVLGVIKPKIYLPIGLNEIETEYILIHEQNHIRRGDHIIRIVSYLALCIHWFNPLVWIAYKTSCKDMEMANDESVIRKKGEAIKKDYSSSLLALSTGKRTISPVPLAFGEGNPKGRIQNIINYKKPVMWVVFASLVFVIGISAGLLLDSQKANLIDNPYEQGTTGYKIIQALNSMPNRDERMVVAQLMYMTPFTCTSSSEEDVIPPTSDEEILDTVTSLTALSGDALNQKIASDIKVCIVKNIDNPNIQWSREFVQIYVKRYCPEYYDRLVKMMVPYEDQFS